MDRQSGKGDERMGAQQNGIEELWTATAPAYGVSFYKVTDLRHDTSATKDAAGFEIRVQGMK
jgi:hypothetical protein